MIEASGGGSRDAAELWRAERPRLMGLAYRILGGWHDAEDVVQQAWVRLSSVELSMLERPEAWLTTVTTRLAIDEGRKAWSRRESYVGPWLPEPVSDDLLPDDVAVGRGLLQIGLLRLMDELEPSDRAVFVLREAFEVPYVEIAECVGRSPAACRQVVSRARARLGESGAGGVGAGGGRTVSSETERRLLTALAAAVVRGEVADVVRLVSGDSVLWSDGGGVTKAALRPIVGVEKVMRFLAGIAQKSGVSEGSGRLVRVNGQWGLWFGEAAGVSGDDRLVTLEHDGAQITGLHLHANPAKLRRVWVESPA